MAAVDVAPVVGATPPSVDANVRRGGQVRGCDIGIGIQWDSDQLSRRTKCSGRPEWTCMNHQLGASV